MRVEAVERLDPDDARDLVLVMLPRHRVNEVLPVLAANRKTPSVMFFGYNAGGPQEMLLVAITRRKLDDKAASIKIGHALGAREKMKAIANEFRELSKQSGIATPAIDQLQPYFDDTNQRAA